MQNELSNLLPFEQRALLEALQRDIRNEMDKALTDPEWADFHLLNAYRVRRICSYLTAAADGNERAL